MLLLRDPNLLHFSFLSLLPETRLHHLSAALLPASPSSPRQAAVRHAPTLSDTDCPLPPWHVMCLTIPLLSLAGPA
jgi:hypothetical protein